MLQRDIFAVNQTVRYNLCKRTMQLLDEEGPRKGNYEPD